MPEAYIKTLEFNQEKFPQSTIFMCADIESLLEIISSRDNDPTKSFISKMILIDPNIKISTSSPIKPTQGKNKNIATKEIAAVVANTTCKSGCWQHI